MKLLGILTVLITLPALAQSAHSINSVQTSPGTSAPINPMTDDNNISRAEPPEHGMIHGRGASEVTADLPRDAGSSTADRKASKKSASLNKLNSDRELPYSNESGSRLPSGSPVPR